MIGTNKLFCGIQKELFECDCSLGYYSFWFDSIFSDLLITLSTKLECMSNPEPFLNPAKWSTTDSMLFSLLLFETTSNSPSDLELPQDLIVFPYSLIFISFILLQNFKNLSLQLETCNLKKKIMKLFLRTFPIELFFVTCYV